MKETILWEEYFYLKLSEYMLSDGEYKIEARINKVKLTAKYIEFEGDIQFSFKIWEGHFNCLPTELFETIDEAQIEAKKRINNIEILVIKED